MNRIISWTLISIVAISSAACGPKFEPIQVSPLVFPNTNIKGKISGDVLVSIADGAFTQRNYYTDHPNYALPYALGNIDQEYVQAVAASVFQSYSFTKPVGSASKVGLRLQGLSHSVLVDSTTSITPFVTDEFVARWVLVNQKGQLVLEFNALGHASSSGSWGPKEIQEQAKIRTTNALIDLHRSTIETLLANRQVFVDME
ncbi:MAG: hypothetical protein OEQ39_28605 [Gammaproteobacteria bacterium]|nr:hypothetical protein [Gammaproteobacteria bacterium]